VSWLQGMVTNDVERLLPGEGTYAAHLNAQGKLVGQMSILVDAEAVWLTTETSNAKKLADALERMIIMEDVVAEQHSGLLHSIGVYGPAASSTLETCLGKPLNLKKENQHHEFPEGRVVRDALGFTVWVRQDESDEMLQKILRSGATLADEATWNALRIEAGLPLYGIDIDESTTMPELGDRGISYDKGCYIGQEVVAKIKYIGHVNRRFIGFVCDGDSVPEPRSAVRSGEKEVGYVTSSVVSPGLGKPIALGFASRSAAASGNHVELVSAEKNIGATVTELPFTPSPTWSSD